MKEKEVDQFHGIGGAYLVGPDGVRVRVEEPTQDHPEGNGPRDKNGELLVFPEKERTKGKPVKVEPAPAAPDSKASPKGNTK